MTIPAPDPIPDPSLAARFEIAHRYDGGEGWSAAVREAGRGGLLFLKILGPEVEVREPSLLASLQHPAIPAVLETGRTADGCAYLLREHREGTPLGAIGPLPADDAVELAVQLLETLAYVHLRDILHLDLKPANVLRCAGEPARYALVDFGLGRRGHATARGGTPFFAAPERLLGLQPDPRSDLFSLGALLFAALHSGPLPFARFTAQFPKQSFFASVGIDAATLPAPFDEFLPRLVARRPDNRFADAQEALEELVGGSGRPSTALLQPDPIRLFSDRLEVVLRALAPQQDLRIAGGDRRDRHALALHAGCILDGVVEIEDDDGASVLRRGGGSAAAFEIPALTRQDLAGHLEAVLALDPATADIAAQLLQARDLASPAAVTGALIGLVEQGRIVPDGPRWVWPDALAGRIDFAPPAALEPSADALRRATSRGHVEAALRAYGAAARDADAATERALRAALAEGLIRGGEPSRALPFVHDLPAHRARALLDLGRVRDAERAWGAAQALSPDALRADAPDLDRLRASIYYARGELEAAAQRTEALIATSDASEHRVLHGLVLTRLGRTDEAITELCGVLTELRADDQPFLRAAALTNLAEAERGRGDLAAAEQHHEAARVLYRSLGHVRYTAMSSNNLGVIAKDLGHMQEARDHLRRARALWLHVGDRAGAALAEANLGVVALESGQAASALRRLERALQELEELGSLQARPLVLVLLARAHAAMGHREAAAEFLQRAGPIHRGRLMDEAEKVRRALRTPPDETPTAPANPPDAGGREAAAPPTRRDVTAPTGAADGFFAMFTAVNRRLAGEADLERAMRFLLDTAVTMVGGRSGYLLVSRPDGLRLELRTGERSVAAATISRSMVHRAIQRRQTLTGGDVLADPELLDMPSVQDLTLRSAICVPFVSALGTEGALYVDHPGRPNAFDDTDKEHLDVLADQASIAVDRMLREEQLNAELAQSRRQLHVAKRALRKKQTGVILGKSKPMQQLRATIAKLADSDLAVLVLGETGTGKELVARALHDESPRRDDAFVSENCSAIPTELMESELFGHVKGAFTGADEDRPGLLELASGGTLFLDEVGDMPPPLQVKLLRVLQEQSARRVGGRESVSIDVRLVAATHKNLRGMIADGSFREDLYFRLAAAEITVPPLRARGHDVALLAEAFLAPLNREHRRSVRLSAAASAELQQYPWPGNVRELEHLIARAFILTDGDELVSLDLPVVTPTAARPSSGTGWPVMSLAEVEGHTIRAVLASTGGDKTKAAKILGISRTSLYEKLKRMKA